MAVSQFPAQPNSAHPSDPTGPPWLKLLQMPDEYPGIVVKRMVVGATRGADSTGIIRRWELTYDGLSAAQAAVLDAHRAEAIDELLGFSFRDPRTDTLYTNVHYDEGYTADHSKTWSQSRTIVLIKEGL